MLSCVVWVDGRQHKVVMESIFVADKKVIPNGLCVCKSTGSRVRGLVFVVVALKSGFTYI